MCSKAVSRPSRVGRQADLLHRLGAEARHGVHVAPAHHQPHRRADALRRGDGQHGVGRQAGLRAEGAADEGRQHLDLRLGQPEGLGDAGARGAHRLRRHPHRQLLAAPVRGGGEHLHRVVVLERRGPGLVDDRGGGGDAGLHVALGDDVVFLLAGGERLGRVDLDAGGSLAVGRPHQRGAAPRGGGVLGHHVGHRLAGVADRGAGHRPEAGGARPAGVEALGRLVLRHRLVRVDGDHARLGHRLADVDRRQLAAGDGRDDELAVEHARGHEVGGVLRLAADLARRLVARHRGVDGAGHGLTPSRAGARSSARRRRRRRRGRSCRPSPSAAWRRRRRRGRPRAPAPR